MDIFGKPDKDSIFQGVICIYFLFSLCFYALCQIQKNELGLMHIFFYLILFIVIGWGQFSLSLAFHDAVHYNFGKHHKDVLAGFVTAYPIGLTMCYRAVHFSHHKFFSDPNKDPDYNDFAYFPSTKLAMMKRFLIMCSGIPATTKFLTQTGSVSGVQCNVAMERIRLVFTQVCIFSLFSVFLGPVYYVFFWVVPVATLGQLFSSTRLLCEHGNPGGDPILRTITGNRFETNTLGMFNFNYHADHHQYMRVPCGNLPAVHKACRKNQISFPNTEYFHGGYLKLLASWFKALPVL